MEGLQEGMAEDVGLELRDGLLEGLLEGLLVGKSEGRLVGALEGRADGIILTLGLIDGLIDGETDGRIDGLSVTKIFLKSHPNVLWLLAHAPMYILSSPLFGYAHQYRGFVSYCQQDHSCHHILSFWPPPLGLDPTPLLEL